MSNISDSVRLIVRSAIPFKDERLPGNINKLNVIQSITSLILVQDVFSLYYFGVRDQEVEHLRAVEEYLKSIGNSSAEKQASAGN